VSDLAGRFAGKTAFVTAARTGIGFAIAAALCRGGANVIAGSTTEPDGEFDQLEDAAGSIAWQRCDVRRAEDHARAVELCLDRFGRIDILVNNAGIIRLGVAHEQSEEDWDDVVGTTLTGTFLGCQAVLPHMVERGGGVILNTISTAASIASPQMPSYVAAKSGVLGLTRQIALDYGRHGVRCNGICPGPTLTPVVRKRALAEDGSFTPLGNWMIGTVPLGRLGDPDEIARAALFLVSDDASFVTGAALYADGGQAIHTGTML
jgi:NAD(P)-dependent dehydrogenase (short-subunit alcohol dehydrogenase family)